MIESCTLITTEANGVVRPVHDRIPVIVPQADHARWLNPAPQDPADLLPLLRPYPEAEMVAYPVSLLVSNPRNDGPECVAPLAG